jgi:hypothetical protein
MTHPVASLRCLSALTPLLLCLFAPPTAFAERFIVTRNIDRADDRPGDGECRSGSLGCTLRAAVQEASARPTERHIIVLPPGFFHLFVGGRDENSSFEGDLDIHGEIAIEGTIRAGRTCPTGCLPVVGEDTVIDGNGNDRIFHVHEGARLLLRAVVLQHGDPGEEAIGGAIFNLGDLDIRRVLITDNDARHGGGIANRGTATIRDTLITRNTSWFFSVPGDGGDNIGGGGIQNDGEMLIDTSTIDRNRAFSRGGGLASDHGRLRLFRSMVSNNRASQGGGVNLRERAHVLETTIEDNEATAGKGGGAFASGFSHPAEVVFEDSRVRGNRAGTTVECEASGWGGCGDGGGIYSFGSTVLRTTIAGNHAEGDGGGLVTGDGRIERSTISGNSADGQGGGVFTRRGSDETALILNSTISGNTSHARGGGLVVERDRRVYLGFTTIARNQAPVADGLLLHLGVVATLKANILAENGESNCSMVGVSPISEGFNRWDVPVGIASGCASLRGVADRAGLLNLGPLRDNGGPTETHALRTGSAARDVVYAFDCTAQGITVATDQRSVVRPWNRHCDAGAFEYRPPLLTVPPYCCVSVILHLDLALAHATATALDVYSLLEKANDAEGLKAADELLTALDAARKAFAALDSAPREDDLLAVVSAIDERLAPAEQRLPALSAAVGLDAAALVHMESAVEALAAALHRLRLAAENAKISLAFDQSPSTAGSRETNDSETIRLSAIPAALSNAVASVTSAGGPQTTQRVSSVFSIDWMRAGSIRPRLPSHAVPASRVIVN